MQYGIGETVVYLVNGKPCSGEIIGMFIETRTNARLYHIKKSTCGSMDHYVKPRDILSKEVASEWME